jgi:hypothetical protein
VLEREVRERRQANEIPRKPILPACLRGIRVFAQVELDYPSRR